MWTLLFYLEEQKRVLISWKRDLSFEESNNNHNTKAVSNYKIWFLFGLSLERELECSKSCVYYEIQAESTVIREGIVSNEHCKQWMWN